MFFRHAISHPLSRFCSWLYFIVFCPKRKALFSVCTLNIFGLVVFEPDFPSLAVDKRNHPCYN